MAGSRLLAVVAVLVTALGLVVGGPLAIRPAAAATGTAVCGSLPVGQTVWTAAGAPYVICPDGVEVGKGAALVISGELGSVDVRGAGAGGLFVDGGALQTTLTTDSAVATFAADPTNSSGRWGGVLVQAAQDGTAPTLQLSHVSISDAQVGLQVSGVEPLSLSSLAFSHNDMGLVADADHVTLTTVTSTGGSIVVGDTLSATLSDVHVSNAPNGDVAVLGKRHWGPSYPLADVQLSNVTSDHNTFGAYLDGVRVTPDDLDAITGYDNTVDVVLFGGELDSSLTWRPIPTNTAPGPLGYALGSDTTVVPGATVTVPVGATMWMQGSLDLSGSSLDACAGGVSLRAGLPNQSELLPVSAVVSAVGGVPGSVCLDNGSDAGVDLTATGDDVAGATTAPLSVTGSTLTDVTLSADSSATRVEHSTWSLGGISVRAAAATLLDDSLDRARIRVTDVTDQHVDVEGNTVTSPSGSGIAVLSPVGYPTTLATDVRVAGNTVTGAVLDPTLPVYPRPTDNAAIVLRSVRLDDMSRVAGNMVGGNLVDALTLSGEVDGALTWVSPYDATSVHPAGFVSDSLVVRGAHTVTIPKGAVVKIGGYREGDVPIDGAEGLHLLGASLTATAGGATFTESSDDSVDPKMCYGYQPCRGSYLHNIFWPGITAESDPDSSARGTVQIAGARMHFGSIVVRDGATKLPSGAPYGVSLTGVTVEGGAVTVANEPALLSTVTVDQSAPTVDGTGYGIPAYPAGVELTNASGSYAVNVRLNNIQYGNPGILLTDTKALLRRVAETWTTSAVFESPSIPGPSGGPAVKASGVAVRVECLTAEQNIAGLELPAGSIVRDSNLDFHVHGSGVTGVTASGPSVDARGNWWGQATGATSGATSPAGDVRVDHPRRVPSSCAPPAVGVSPAVPTAPPMTLTRGSHWVKVAWTAPKSDGGTAVTSYVVTLGVRTAIVSAATRSTVFRNLVNGVLYRVTVAASNVDGRGYHSVGWIRPHA